MPDPLDLFREWHRDACRTGSLTHPNAMCVSTTDENGVPHARFVDLKTIRPDGFVFCTSHSSPKARHLDARAAVSLTFWWDHVGRQVRVLGTASRLAAGDADAFFTERSREAQLASWAYDQSQPLLPGEALHGRADTVRQRFEGGPVPRPPHWGGYVVAPDLIEFLVFSADRVHERRLYQLKDSAWSVAELQP
jgi:pyridoxamine 5'-phosphate oxidase